MKAIWCLLSGKVNLQKIFIETKTVDKAAQHKDFQCDDVELGYGYILSNGEVIRAGEVGFTVFELLKDLVETINSESDSYKVAAQLIAAGYKIEIDSENEIYYYSKFHSVGKFPLDPEYDFEEAKRAIRRSYKKRNALPFKGPFDNPVDCHKIIRDDKAYQQIIENELDVLGDYIVETLNKTEEEADDLMMDLYTSLDEVDKYRKSLK